MEAVSEELGVEAPVVVEEWNADPHPWRRYGARLIDVQLFGGAALLVLAFAIGLLGNEALFQWVTDGSRWKSLLIFTPLTWIFTAAFVAALLAWKGTTPGKLLFGLRVRPADDAPLTFRRAMMREAMLLVWGIGFAIPLLNLIAMVSSYSAVDSGERTRWDERTDLVVEGRRVAGWQLAGVVLGVVIVVIALGWSVFARVAAALPGSG